MKASGKRGSSGTAVGAVALASMLKPMLTMARPHGRREFATGAGTATWLDTVAFVAALGGNGS
jgi:hypothetical protein